MTSVHRRRRWSAEEKARIVQEAYAPGMSVSGCSDHAYGAYPINPCGVSKLMGERMGRAGTYQ